MVGFKTHNFLQLFSFVYVSRGKHNFCFPNKFEDRKILPLIRQRKLNFSQSITSVPLIGDFITLKNENLVNFNEFKMIVSNTTQDDVKTMKYFFLEIKADDSSMDATDVFENVLKIVMI